MNEHIRDTAVEKRAHVWAQHPEQWYVEEESASAALFKVERFVGHIWDPSCGMGNVLKAATASGYAVHGTDIVKRTDAHWFRGVRDFLTWDEQPLAQNLMFNPPFFRGKGTESFIRKALPLARGKVAVFADLRFLAGDERASNLWFFARPHRVWILTPRVSCPPGEYLLAGNKAGGGTADWCWLVWDLTAPPAATSELHWLRCGKPKKVVA